jgi:hypothetical protein
MGVDPVFDGDASFKRLGGKVEAVSPSILSAKPIPEIASDPGPATPVPQSAARPPDGWGFLTRNGGVTPLERRLLNQPEGEPKA